MSQTWTDNCYGSGNVGQTDLQVMENNFACLKSSFSGTSSPSDAVAGMPWFDTTQKVLKIREANNSSWYGLMHGDTSQKILVYRNTAMDGWAIDSSSATDRVVALKGGSTYTTGGANAGSWTISGISNTSSGAHTHSHNHVWYYYNGDTSDDITYDAYGNMVTLPLDTKTNPRRHIWLDQTASNSIATTYTSNDATAASTLHTHTASHAGTWRISAAVMTMQYLDL